MRLRPATDDDAAGVVALVGRVFAEYPGVELDVDGEETTLRAPASSYTRFWVLVDIAGTILGCCAGTAHDDHWEMKKVYLDRHLRGNRWGRRLIERVEQDARDHGNDRIELWSDTRFETAHAVYEKMGYERTGATRPLHDRSGTIEYEFAKRL